MIQTEDTYRITGQRREARGKRVDEVATGMLVITVRRASGNNATTCSSSDLRC